jgi:hypothetical protein
MARHTQAHPHVRAALRIAAAEDRAVQPPELFRLLTSPIAQTVGLPLRGGLVYSTPDDRGQTYARYNNFAPRVSFAYKVTDRFVVRSGYGISYARAITEQGVNGNDGYNVTTPWLTDPGGVVPQILLQNPFPNGFLVPTGSSLGAASQLGLSPVAWRRDNPTPYVQSYSFDIQYEISPDRLWRWAIPAMLGGNSHTACL